MEIITTWHKGVICPSCLCLLKVLDKDIALGENGSPHCFCANCHSVIWMSDVLKPGEYPTVEITGN